MYKGTTGKAPQKPRKKFVGAKVSLLCVVVVTRPRLSYLIKYLQLSSLYHQRFCNANYKSS